MNKKGSLYLIPTELSIESEKDALPLVVTKHIKKINIFIVENIRTSRRYIKKIYPDKKIEDIIFYSYAKHNKINLETLLQHILNNEDVGLLSEAGLPCIADPGSKIVDYAHNMNIKVIPITGPSSIFLALMASGMNGQHFTFNGYLPINKTLRIKKLKKIERDSKEKRRTQIFIETPYRNVQLLNTILQICNKRTKLCIASSISTKKEFISTKKITEWKEEKINLHKLPTIFLIESN